MCGEAANYTNVYGHHIDSHPFFIAALLVVLGENDVGGSDCAVVHPTEENEIDRERWL